MDLKEIIYGLIKIARSRVFTIHEEEILRSAIGYLADRLYESEVLHIGPAGRKS